MIDISSFEWQAKNAVEYVVESQKQIASLKKQLLEAKQSNGKLIEYEIPTIAKVSIDKLVSEWNKTEKLYEEAKVTCEKNTAAFNNNIRVRDKLLSVIEASGYPRQKVEYKGRSQKRTESPHAWTSDLYHLMPPNGRYLTKWLEDFWKELNQKRDAIRTKKEAEQKQKQQEQDKARRERMKIAELVIEAKELGLDAAECDLDDMINEVRSKDKYLDLAVVMEETRNDWSDGFDGVESALGRFNADSPVDQLIYDDISACLECEDRDGRIFRDTEYNYSVLYGMADQKWVNIYTKLNSLVERRW